jgi:hypothetical protein
MEEMSEHDPLAVDPQRKQTISNSHNIKMPDALVPSNSHDNYWSGKTPEMIFYDPKFDPHLEINEPNLKKKKKSKSQNLKKKSKYV